MLRAVLRVGLSFNFVYGKHCAAFWFVMCASVAFWLRQCESTALGQSQAVLICLVSVLQEPRP